MENFIDSDIYNILLAIYDYTCSRYPISKAIYSCQFSSIDTNKCKVFEILSCFPLLCKAGLLIFNEKKEALLTTIRIKRYARTTSGHNEYVQTEFGHIESGQRESEQMESIQEHKVIYTYRCYPNGCLHEEDQTREYNPHLDFVVRLQNGKLYYIRNLVEIGQNLITYHSDEVYRESYAERLRILSNIEALEAYEIRLYGSDNYYYVYDDIVCVYQYHPLGKEVHIYSANRTYTYDLSKKLYNIEINSLSEFMDFIYTY